MSRPPPQSHMCTTTGGTPPPPNRHASRQSSTAEQVTKSVHSKQCGCTQDIARGSLSTGMHAALGNDRSKSCHVLLYTGQRWHWCAVLLLYLCSPRPCAGYTTVVDASCLSPPSARAVHATAGMCGAATPGWCTGVHPAAVTGVKGEPLQPLASHPATAGSCHLTAHFRAKLHPKSADNAALCGEGRPLKKS